MDKKYKQLAEAIQKLADQTDGSNKHIVQAMSYQVDATGDLDTQLEELNQSIKDLNKVTTKLMTRQIWLILIQIVVGVIVGWAAIQLTR